MTLDASFDTSAVPSLISEIVVPARVMSSSVTPRARVEIWSSCPMVARCALTIEDMMPPAHRPMTLTLGDFVISRAVCIASTMAPP